MVMPLSDILPILQCPRTGTSLSFDGDLLISEAGERYPIVNGKPVLVRQIQDFHITPPTAAHISKNTATYSPPPHIKGNAVCLHLGSGDVPSEDRRVISLDILPTASTDIVAEAEALPFKTGSLDYVESGAVFEHVFSPIEAAAEVRRILKDGGEMFIDTAFLQGYHGFPSHYFNMTPQAVETFICDDFILENSYVPQAAMVTHALATQISRFLELLPGAARNRIQSGTVSEMLADFRSQTTHHDPLTRDITEYGHRSLAASFAVTGRKPSGYDHRRGVLGDSAADRAAYYAARLAIMQRAHEIEHYKRATTERGGKTINYAAPNWREILNSAKVTEPQKPGAYQSATAHLAQWDRNLSVIRDEVIGLYMAEAQRRAGA